MAAEQRQDAGIAPGPTTSGDGRTGSGNGDGRLKTCARCQAPNSPRRELCGRCGADLDSGMVPPRLSARAAAALRPAPAADRSRRRRRRWPWTLLAILVTAALVVAGLSLAGVEVFARGPAVPEATFDAAAYPEQDLRTLTLSDVATSTTLGEEGGSSSTPTEMVDDDPTTAWVSDGEQLEDGVGERIDLFLDEPAWIERIVIANGDQRSASAYDDNARVERAQLTLDGGTTAEIELLDEGRSRQVVELRRPQLTTTIRLEVLETDAGETEPNLAVTDLELQGYVADGDDAAIARERAEARRAAGSVAQGS